MILGLTLGKGLANLSRGQCLGRARRIAFILCSGLITADDLIMFLSANFARMEISAALSFHLDLPQGLREIGRL